MNKQEQARKIRDLLLSTNWDNKRLAILFLIQLDDFRPILDAFWELGQVILLLPKHELKAFAEHPNFINSKRAFFWTVSSSGYTFDRDKGPPYYILPHDAKKFFLKDVGDLVGYIDRLEQLTHVGFYKWENYPIPRLSQKSLECLIIYGIEPQQLARTIWNFKNLQELRINDAKLAQLPPNLELGRLRTLNLASNQLSEIHDKALLAKSLKLLNLAKNPLKQLGNIFEDFKALERLYLYQTEITELSESIKYCKMLEVLNLSRTSIDALPKALKYTRLKELKIVKTKIKSLPDYLFDMNLWSIDLTGSPMAEDEDYMSFLRNKMPKTILKYKS